MKLIKIILLLLIFHSANFSQKLFRGDVFISDLSSNCIDTTYIHSFAARSFPEVAHFKKDKLVYEIILSIRLYGNEYSYDRAIAVTFRTPDNNISTIIINQDLYPLTIDEEYEYVFNIQSREKGWVNVELNEWDIYNLEIRKNININFLSYSFYID